MRDLIDGTLQRQREAEQLLVGASFIAPADILQQYSWLQPDDFLDTVCRDYWGSLLEHGDPVRAALDNHVLDAVMQWKREVPSAFYANEYVRQIQRAAYVLRQARALPRLAQDISNGDVEAVSAHLRDMAGDVLKEASQLPTAPDVDAQFAAVVRCGARSVLSHIAPLDKATGGLERQTLSILAARPSMGKSALAWQIARNVAVSGGKVLFFSLEMAATALWARAACGVAGVTWRDVRSGRLSQEQITRLLQVSSELANRYGAKLVIDDTSHTSETLWQVSAGQEPDLVLVDHLKLLNDRGDNEDQRLGQITWKLKQIAKRLDCHVMVLAQLNRKTEDRPDHRPQLADLRDSGNIEQNSDLVCMLYRPGYYEPTEDTAECSPTELWLRKFRDGPSNVLVRLGFNKLTQWFDSASQ